ncbi:hypothetical protein BD560DRAFT_42847 [Blakeslea trispora]|nr:hypothetical protein BD560DRAFT_42847 [Blakeslea trispora]
MLKKPSQIFSNKTRVASGTSFTLKSISLGSQVRKTVSPAKEGSNQYIIYAMPQAGHESKLTLLRKSLQSQNVEFASLLFHKHIADFEFFDSNELVILAEDEEKTVLHTVLLETLEFKASANCLLVPQVLQPHRSQVLEDMLKTKIECNGREKRRIFCITASNGYFRTFSMGNEQKGIQEEKDK